MLTSLLLAASLIAQSQSYATRPPECSVHTFQKGEGMAGLFPDDAHVLKASKTRTVYLCDAFYGMGSTMQVTVPKPWFAQHCTTAYENGARCDAVYEGAGNPAAIAKAAAPPKDHPHLRAIEYGVGTVAFLAFCVIGGCGFMGGGL